MAEDMELTDALINRLKSMKIERITVHGHPLEMGGAGAGTKYAERKERLDHLFRKHTSDKWMMRVKKRMEQYFGMKAAAQEARQKAIEAVETEEVEGAAPEGHESRNDEV